MTASAFQRKLAGDPEKLRPLNTPATKTLELKPEQFSSTWANRPVAPITIGLRITSERDREGASIEALRSISERALDEEERDRCVANAYTRIMTARGICDPFNVTKPHPLLPLPDDQIARAFPPSTIRWIFDELDALNIAQSPGFSEASDEEIARLVTILELDDPISYLPGLAAARVRRLLWAVLTELESV